MMTDPALADLPFVAYAEPPAWPAAMVAVATAAPENPARARPPWETFWNCRGAGDTGAAGVPA